MPSTVTSAPAIRSPEALFLTMKSALYLLLPHSPKPKPLGIEMWNLRKSSGNSILRIVVSTSYENTLNLSPHSPPSVTLPSKQARQVCKASLSLEYLNTFSESDFFSAFLARLFSRSTLPSMEKVTPALQVKPAKAISSSITLTPASSSNPTKSVPSISNEASI